MIFQEAHRQVGYEENGEDYGLTRRMVIDRSKWARKKIGYKGVLCDGVES